MMKVTTNSIFAAGVLTLATALSRVAAGAPADATTPGVSRARALASYASTAPQDDDSGDGGDSDDSGDDSD
jgi:hypothetical protein